jgi:hypothetical protein
MSTTTVSPNGWAVTVGTANQLAIGPNSSRSGLIFFNNSSSATIAVCPSSQNIIAQGTAPAAAGATTSVPGSFTGPVQGVAAISGAGSINLTPGQAQIIDNLNCTAAWNAIASANGAALTILEF